MDTYYKIFFYFTSAFVILGIVMFYRRKVSAINNRNVALSWFEDMDVISKGQRFKGNRSTIVFDAGSSTLPGLGYELMLGCRTMSGREYFVRVVSTYGVVTEWGIALAEPGEFNEELGISGDPVARKPASSTAVVPNTGTASTHITV